MDIEVLEKFHSKRNQVYKVRIYTSTSAAVSVMKKYEKDKVELLTMEYNNLNMLRHAGLSVPEVIYMDKDSLFLEYIDGILVNDLVESLTIGQWIEGLSEWLYKLHQMHTESYSIIKGDANLRNFIYSNDKIYGLDFEEMMHGDARTDLADICFFILTNHPSFTKEKHIIMREFLYNYEKCSGSELKNMSKFLRWSKEEAKRRRIHL